MMMNTYKIFKQGIQCSIDTDKNKTQSYRKVYYMEYKISFIPICGVYAYACVSMCIHIQHTTPV